MSLTIVKGVYQLLIAPSIGAKYWIGLLHITHIHMKRYNKMYNVKREGSISIHDQGPGIPSTFQYCTTLLDMKHLNNKSIIFGQKVLPIFFNNHNYT